MSTILVLGGYGGFGARISLRLAKQGHEVIVAGRSLMKARTFCRRAPRLTPLAVDRRDLAAALTMYDPDMLVDASGPFQHMDYAVPRICIAAGVPYCDIADGRDFVCGISRLDAEAWTAGVVIVSGASSVPALSGAVARELAVGFDTVSAVEMAISASNRAAAGKAVSGAILGQVGQPIRLPLAGWQTCAFGWSKLQRLDFEVPGSRPIRRRLVAVVDVPDLQLLPDRLAGRPVVVFRAGTELAFQNVALWLASFPVRWGWIRNLTGLSGALLPLQRLTRRLGTDRSAMTVRLFGHRGKVSIERRWTLIADEGDGPEIPAMAVPAIVERTLAGQLPPGARDEGHILALADFESEFAGLAIRHAVVELPCPQTLYRRIMGAEFNAMAPMVRQLHSFVRESAAAGEARVDGGRTGLARWIARMMRFPPPGDYPLQVAFSERAGVEVWTRDFGGNRFSSKLSQAGALLVERFGPLRFHFDLLPESSGLRMAMRRWSILHLPLPLACAPRVKAREWEEGGWFRFAVSIRLPLIGQIADYRGRLKPLPAKESS